MTALADQIEACAAETAAYLDSYLAQTHPDLAGVPERLLAAVRHGALDGGKRLRPFLVRAGAGLFGVGSSETVATGAAVECVHCYSLIHDDLPEMDNDRLRRGKPTVWAAYDPATAILAGDTLLTHAFAILADPTTHPDPAVRAELVRRLAVAAGAGGMVGGQMADIGAQADPLDAESAVAMLSMKTGALIAAAVAMGGVLGGADAAALEALDRYGRAAGLAFQLADDILDATQSSEALGKTAGKDAVQNKSTLVALESLDAARARRDETASEAIDSLAAFGPGADTLRALARHFAERQA